MRFKTQSIIHYFGAQPSFLLYGFAVLAVAIAAIVTHFIPVIGERAAFLVFFFRNYSDRFLARTESGTSRDDFIHYRG
jgi:hypothetical protein